MSFSGGGGAGGSEALAYFIRAYDMATPVFRAFGAEVNAVTKQVQASMAEMNRQLASQNKAVADSAATQKAALGEVSAAQVGAADAAVTASDEQVAAARAAATAAMEQAAAAKKAAEAQVAAAEESAAAMSRAGTSVGRTGRNIALVLAGATAASLDFAAKFQSNTLRMETQAGASVKQLALLRQGLLQMGGQVGATPDQLATGMFHVVSAMNQVIPPAKRVSVELNIMRAAAEGSQIGQSNLEDTAYALSSAMNALHKSTGDAYKVMGVLNATVGSGDMTMQDLIDAFKSGLIPAANSFGVSISSVGAALAVMGDMGMRGALAGTRLRMALSLMAAPTDQATKVLETLGLTSKQATADTKAMQDALAKAGVNVTMLSSDLRKPDGIAVALADLDSHLKSSGLSAEAAGAAISRAFGGGRMGAAITLLAENTDRLGLKFDYINRKSNQFGHDWALTQATFRIQVDKALAAVEALGIAMGDKLMPYATMALHELEDMAHWLLRNQTALEALGGAIVTFSAVAIGAWFFSKLKGAIGLIKEFGLAAKGFGGWLFGMGPTPSAAGPAAEMSTAITDAGTQAATRMGSSIQTAGVKSAEVMSTALNQAMSRSLMVPVGGTSAARSGGLFGSLSSSGKLFGYMGSDIMVGTMRNPVSVMLAGQGLTPGMTSTAANAEKQVIGAAAAPTLDATAATQLSLLDQETAQVATAAQEMSIAGVKLTDMNASMLEWYGPMIKQMDTNVANQTKAAMDSANYADFMAKATTQLEEQVGLFGDDIAGLTLAVDKIGLSGALVGGVGSTALAGEQLGLGGLANYVSRGATVPMAYVPGFAPGAASVSAEQAALSTEAQITRSETSLSSMGGLRGLGMSSLPLEASVVAAALKNRVSGVMPEGILGSAKAAAGDFMGSLMRGGMMATMGTMISQLVGGMVKGQAGSWIKAIGTGASLGAGAGMVIPVIGPVAGAAIGTAVAAGIKTGVATDLKNALVGAPPGAGQALPLTHPFAQGTEPSLPKTLFNQINADLLAAARMQNTAHGRNSTGGILGLVEGSPPPQPMSPLQTEKLNNYYFDAGSKAAGYLIKGWNSYKFPDPFVMTEQLIKGIQKFPPQAQAVAAEAAINFAMTLEKEGRLPAKQAQLMVQLIENRFHDLPQYMGITATDAMKAWQTNFSFQQWESSLSGTLKSMGQQFQGVQFAVDSTTGTIQKKTEAAIVALRHVASNPLMSPAERAAARTDITKLADDLNHGFTAMAQTANTKGQQLLATVTNYSTQASLVAATQFNLTNAQANLDQSTQNIINTIQTRWGLMRGVTSTTASDISNNMVVAFTTLEAIVKNKTGAAKAEGLANLQLLRDNGTAYMNTLQSQTILDIGKMSKAIVGGSQSAAAAGVQQFSYFSGQVQALMQSGVVHTTQGMAVITQALVTGLQALGINIKPGDLAGSTVAQLQGYYKWATTGAGGGSNAGPGHHAMGGRVPGLPGADNWTIMDPSGRPAAMVQGGELLIPNRQTEARVNAKLMRGAAAGLWDPTTLSGEVSGETVPHHAIGTRAWGGMVPKAGLGVGYSGTPSGPGSTSTGSVGLAGYVFPIPKGDFVSWARIDQGQDIQAKPGSPVLAIGPGMVSVGSDAFSGFGASYPIEVLSAGPWAGRGVYYGHAKDTRTGRVTAGEAIGVTQTRPDEWTAAPAGWLEFGFTTALGQGIQGQGAAVAPMLHALETGHMVAGIGGVSIPTIKQPKWTGPGGIIGMAGQQVLKIYTSAANALLQSKAGVMGGAGVVGAPGTKGTWGQPGYTITGKVSTFGPPGEAAGQTASGVSDAVPGISLHIPGTHFSDPSNEHLMGHTFRVNIAGHSAILPDIDVGPADWVGRAIDVTGAGAARMGINPSAFPTDSIGSATLVRAMGGRVGWGGAHAQGGIVSVDQPTLALFGEGGPETAIFIPAGGVSKTPEQLAHLGMAGDSSPSTSYSHGSGQTSTGKPTSTSGTTTTEIIGNKEVTTTYHTHTGPTGTSTYTTTTTRPVSYTTGFNPLTDRVETHTSAQWAQIHAAYSQQQHDAAAAKKKHDKWLAHHVTDLIQIGGLPAGYIELTRKLAKQEHLPLGGSFTPADIGKLSQEGQKRVLTALNQFMAKASLGQLMSLSRSMVHTISQPGHPEHKRYVEYHHLHKEAQKHSAEAEKLHHRVEEVLHHAKQWEAGAKQNRAAARQETGKAREELLRMAHQDHEKAMELTRKAHSDRNKWGEQAHKDHQEALQETRKANKIGAQISQSPAGQAAADIINAATKSIMAAFTTTQQKFSAILTTVGLLEKVPPGSTAHSLGLTNIQMKAMGLTRKEIRKLAGGDNSATGLESPAAYLEVIKLLTHKEIPADQRTVRLLDQEYRDALKVHNHALAKSLLGRIDKVTQAEIQASSDLQTAQTNLIEAKYQAAETAIGNMQSRSDIIGSIQGLAPGTSLKSLGLNSRILKSLGFSPKMIKELPSLEGSSFGYIQELEQQQGGKLTATQINRFKSGIGVQNEILARMRKKDVKTLDQLEQELPNLRGTARTTAETHIKDLSKNVLDLTNTMAENNKEVQQLTKATVSNTTATGQMTGSVGFSYQNQDYVAAGSQSSERLVNVNLG